MFGKYKIPLYTGNCQGRGYPQLFNEFIHTNVDKLSRIEHKGRTFSGVKQRLFKIPLRSGNYKYWFVIPKPSENSTPGTHISILFADCYCFDCFIPISEL